MINEHVTELLTGYLDGLLDTEKQAMVETHLKSCEACAKEASDLKKLLHAFSSEDEIIPPPSIKAKFLEQLEEEKNSRSKVVSLDSDSTSKRNLWANNLLKIAASIALLVGGFLLGRQQSQESSNQEIAQLTEEKMEFKQTAMLSLMENESASKRIQGVNFIEEFVNPDEAIIKALADRMLYDDNTNVRAAAVEVLAGFTSSENVKNTFIKALKIENDPGIQIEIIQTLGKMQEKKAVIPMQELLKKEETQPFVKKQIESLLPTII